MTQTVCRSALRFAVLLSAGAILAGCGGDEFTEAEKATIQSMSLAALPPLPADPSNNINPTFTFSSPDPEAEFEYKLDLPDPLEDIVDWEGTDKVLTLTGLVDGTYTIQVQALDEFKNADPTPAIYTWTVDTVAPVTTISGVPSASTSTTAGGPPPVPRGGVASHITFPR